MPITSRLSRRLYETFGDEAGADMVDWMQGIDAHRIELRELNESNYARIEARLAQLEAGIVGRLETKIEERVGALEAKLEQRTGALEAKLEQRIGTLDAKFERRVGDLMRWSLVFWVGAVGAIAALAGVLG